MKPRIAFFDMAGCEGCQLAILDCEDILMALLDWVEIVEFRELLTETCSKFDIAFVEGSVHREMDVEKLKEIRRRSDWLVSLGSCAYNGNVQARTNTVSPDQNMSDIYGERAYHQGQRDPQYGVLWAHSRVRALSDVVDVDYHLRGCPVDREDFLKLLKSRILRSLPRINRIPVCVECKRNGNECVCLTGDTCMGQITWGGCGAVCVSHGYRCDGCRGLLPDVDRQAHYRFLVKRGMSSLEIAHRYRLFCAAEIEDAKH